MALALASCSTQRPVPRPAPVFRPQPPQPAPPAVAPAAFVTAAASIDLFVVRACEMALGQSSDPRIIALARRFVEDHRGLGAQLSLAGRRLNALPAARLLTREEQRLARLAGQRPFEPAFIAEMSAAHRQSLALHAAFAVRGASPTLRPLAANGEQVERRHLAMLGAL